MSARLGARRPIVIANWKMYLGAPESLRTARAIRVLLRRLGRSVDVVLCPSFPLLAGVRDVLGGSRLQLGAQDLHAERSGPYTGDVSAAHLRGLVRFAIVGHSERRRVHGETDQSVAGKVRQALGAGLSPILCVGETAEERNEGKTIARVREQVRRLLRGVPSFSISRCVVAYEPMWAVSQGIGQPALQPDPKEAAEVMRLIRKVVADQGSRSFADRLRVVYGGSVEAKTVRPFVEEQGVDGVLVGAASTIPAEFAAIVKTVAACHS